MARESIGPYQIVRLLGRGGMGHVYEAVHRTLKRRVAIKLLHAAFASNPDAVSRLLAEGVAANVVDHPGVVQIYDCGQTDDGTPFLVMEYLNGQTLAERIKERRAPFSEREVLALAYQLASPLSAAHDRRIVHRDLKPANIMFVPDPAAAGGERVKLLDFGVAKLAQDLVEGKKRTTQTGMMLGTPSYMSPEQCRSVQEIDGKADVYSLGIVLYQLLAGRLPFNGQHLDVLTKHLNERPPPLSDLAPSANRALLALIHRMLEKAPERRPLMSEVGEALDQLRSVGVPTAVGGEGAAAAAAAAADPSSTSDISQTKVDAAMDLSATQVESRAGSPHGTTDTDDTGDSDSEHITNPLLRRARGDATAAGSTGGTDPKPTPQPSGRAPAATLSEVATAAHAATPSLNNRPTVPLARITGMDGTALVKSPSLSTSRTNPATAPGGRTGRPGAMLHDAMSLLQQPIWRTLRYVLLAAIVLIILLSLSLRARSMAPTAAGPPAAAPAERAR